MNLDLNTLVTPAPLLLGMCIATILWIFVSARLKPAKPLYQETSTEDKAKIQKLQSELSAASEHQEKIAEVHAYTLALEQKIKDLESLAGGDTAELGLKVKVLESQLSEKADVEARLAVALQQLADARAKAEIFDSVVGAPAAEPVPVPTVAQTVTDPFEEPATTTPEVELEPVAETPAPVEVDVPAEVIEETPVEEVAHEEVVVEEVAHEEVPAVAEVAEQVPVATPVTPEPAVAQVFEEPPVQVTPAPAVPTPIQAPAAHQEVVAPAAARLEHEAVGIRVLQNDSPQRDPHSAGATAPAISERPALRVESVAAPVLLDNRDPLEKIDGIGQVYQIKLYESGILTFAQLAAASPSRITEIIEPQNWQVIDIMKWRREAALYAAGVKE